MIFIVDVRENKCNTRFKLELTRLASLAPHAEDQASNASNDQGPYRGQIVCARSYLA